MTAHPAALVLDDHQPVYVTASTKPAAMVRCSCDVTVQWCDFAAHQTEALAAAGLLADVRGVCGLPFNGGHACDLPAGHAPEAGVWMHDAPAEATAVEAP